MTGSVPIGILPVVILARSEEPLENRSAILQRALALFAAQGYDAVSVQEIVAAAGVTKPTLYHYFGNKRGVLETLVREELAPLDAQLASATAYAGDLTHSLRAVAAAYFAFAQARPPFYRMLLAMSLGPPDNDASLVVAAATAPQRRAIEALFEAASAQHGNMRGRQRLYAALLLGAIHAYVAQFLHGALALDEDALTHVVQHFSYGIYS